MWQSTGLWLFSHFYSLYNSWFFSQMLLGFASFSLSFSNPTIPAWQLHITFMTISTQPPSSCSFLQTALKSQSLPHKQFRSHSHWLYCPRGVSVPLVQGPSITLQRWVGLIPQALLSSQDHQQGSTEQKILWQRTGTFYLSCFWSSCSVQGGTLGTPIYTWILASGL